MKLAGVLDLESAGHVADSGQLPIGNLARLLTGIVEVQTIWPLAIEVWAGIKNLQSQFEIAAVAFGRWFRF